VTLTDFIAQWQASRLTERAAAQSHFLDLCRVLGQPAPASDPTGERYTFEKGVTKTGGGRGFADVWRRGHFAWEYKGKRKSLADAYQQLLRYREDLENPPLLVVCDLDRFEVHTNFTGTVKQVYAFSLADLARPAPTETSALPPLDVLRALFEDPARLRPGLTTEGVTQTAARSFGLLAQSLHARGHDPHPASRFLIRLLFCLFAEDVGLLPPGLFTLLAEKTRTRPDEFSNRLGLLFEAMRTGGAFGADDIKCFNGGLFQDADVLPLTRDDLAVLVAGAKLDWASIEPSVFGTLFERSLDPAKRAQLGAHYTSRADILLLVEPVLMAPLRRRWEAVRQGALALASKRDAAPTAAGRTRLTGELDALLQGFSAEIAAVRVLDPACGSGNFLYVALRALLDLEKDVLTFALAHDSGGFFPRVGPEQMHGIEVNEYAHELAPITVWIGYIQWLRDNGFGQPAEPILRRLDTIVSRDAVLGTDAGGRPAEPEWPAADVILGNPPFLGGKMLRAELGDAYVDALFALYDGKVARESDLVTYWFERARRLVEEGKVRRVGLLATNSIRGGANRRVLERIKAGGDIFLAWADRPWVLSGAAVRVSIVGFDGGEETERTLDGLPAAAIHADLTGALDLTAARRLPENGGLAFMGDTKGGAFDIPGALARAMLAAPSNPNGRPNSDVVRPWVNGLDVTRRPRGMFIIDFGIAMTEADASFYELPFEYVRAHVKPEREKSRSTRSEWWLHERPRPDLRAATDPLPRFIVTPTVAKHRLFAWLEHPTLADHQVIAIARADDYFFGVLHSRAHELWAVRKGTFMGAGNDPRYTPTTTFETFPFPWPPGQEPQGDPRVAAIAAAARDLAEKRAAWLAPPDAAPADLAKRTLTGLYNARPGWLDTLHRALDAAVLAAYGWPVGMADEALLEGLLGLNVGRTHPSASADPPETGR